MILAKDPLPAIIYLLEHLHSLLQSSLVPVEVSKVIDNIKLGGVF